MLRVTKLQSGILAGRARQFTSVFVICLAIVLLRGILLAAQDDLETKLLPLIQRHSGRVAVGVKQLEGSEKFFHQADLAVPTASLIKFPVMVEVYRQAEHGDVEMGTMITFREEDRVPGSGLLTSHFSAGAQLSLRDAVRLMIAFSDNTATNLVLDRIGLPATAATMEQMGYPETKIHSQVYRRETSILPERSRRFGLGSTTAAEMTRLLEQLHQGQLVSPEASREMYDHLLSCQDRAKLAKYLPQNVRLAHKTGAVAAVRCDAGILETPLGPVAITVLTSENEDQSWGSDNQAEELCGRIGEVVWRHFHEPANRKSGSAGADESAPTILREGSTGRLVEDLQRTLNARLDPSPQLSVDGDFGPITAAAVRDFQQQQELEVTGAMDRLSWQRLGPIVTGDEGVPSPDVVNQEVLSRRPADERDGIPFVTAKAWAVADGDSGELVGGHAEDQSLPMASTTKMMTAFVILRRAAEDSSILAEAVTFSQRADDTIGSTSGLRAGERVTVGELLYGLLLPSGNDASVALAEHFGPRWHSALKDSEASSQGSSTDEEPTPEERFIAVMNVEARRLGMQATRFANPHGLTAPDHHASARDLIVLARAAMDLPQFCDYVSTRRRGCEVEGSDGYRRYVVWNNTNQLLEIEGYEGVKTGTTQAAGACLVSSVRRGDRRLLAVVLGAESSAGRYADTRNLLRWAWQANESGVD